MLNITKPPQLIAAIALSGLGIIISTTTATAASITFEQAFSGTSPLVDMKQGRWIDFTIAPVISFDSSLGTLTNISVETTARGRATYNAAVNLSVNPTTGERLVTTVSGGLSIAPVIFTRYPILASQPAVSFGGTKSFSSSGQDVLFDQQGSGVSNFASLPPTSGTTSVGVYNFFGYNASGDTGVVRVLQGSVSVDGTMRVTFDYTPIAIPTPALLPGLLGLGLVTWRKHKANVF